MAVLGLPVQGWAEQVDVSGQVTVTKSGLRLNRTSNTFDSAVTLTNSLMAVTAPAKLVVSGLSNSSVTLANASGTTADGKPYINLNITGTWTPGNTLNSTLKFSNPQKVGFTFTTQVFADVQTGSNGSDSTIQTVSTDGARIELPGVASVNIPQGALSSGAVQVSVINSPKLTQLLVESSEYKPLNVPQLQIKSSAPLYLPVQVVIPYPSVMQDSNGGSIKVASYVKVDHDSDTPEDSLELFDAKICGNQDAICATLSPSAFSPVPLDPDAAIQQILKVDQSTLKPGNNGVQVDTNNPLDTTTFQATIQLQLPSSNSGFQFKDGTPVDGLTVPPYQLFGSSYKLNQLKSGETVPSGPHKGVDLFVTYFTNVKAVFGGDIITRGRETNRLIEYCSNNAVNTIPQPLPAPTDYLSRQLSEPKNIYSPVPPGWDRNKTHSMVLDHGSSIYSVYRHLSQFNLPVCDVVKAGDEIAESGDTGLPGKAHLHFEISLGTDKLANEIPIDPRPLLLKDMAQYLLHKDPNDVYFDTIDIEKGLTVFLKLRIDGNDARYSILDKLSADDLMGILRWRNPNIPEKWGAAGAEVFAYSSGSNGSNLDLLKRDNVKLNYKSKPINLGAALQYDVQYSGSGTIQKFLKDHAVTVDLEACSFRLNGCHELASWQVSEGLTQVTVDATTGSTGKGAVTSSPAGIVCNTGSSDKCSYGFASGSTVTLTAASSIEAGSYSAFAGWSGVDANKCLTGTAPTVCSLPSDGIPKNITATFKPVNLSDRKFSFGVNEGPLIVSHNKIPVASHDRIP